MAGSEHGLLQALSGALLGAMVINRECFLEERDRDVQQQQRWSTSSLMKRLQHQTNVCLQTAKEVHLMLQLLEMMTCERNSPASPWQAHSAPTAPHSGRAVTPTAAATELHLPVSGSGG